MIASGRGRYLDAAEHATRALLRLVPPEFAMVYPHHGPAWANAGQCCGVSSVGTPRLPQRTALSAEKRQLLTRQPRLVAGEYVLAHYIYYLQDTWRESVLLAPRAGGAQVLFSSGSRVPRCYRR